LKRLLLFYSGPKSS